MHYRVLRVYELYKTNGVHTCNKTRHAVVSQTAHTTLLSAHEEIHRQTDGNNVSSDRREKKIVTDRKIQYAKQDRRTTTRHRQTEKKERKKQTVKQYARFCFHNKERKGSMKNHNLCTRNTTM